MIPRFLLGTQYFRPPTPGPEQWAGDLADIRAAGLNSVQLWVVWGWVEPSPGEFRFDDYDALFDLADRNGLGVVLSVLPEVGPFWMERVEPEAVMIDGTGRAVPSAPRLECLSGAVPGACSDHPGARARMANFLTTTAGHFARRSNLLAWDIWNENRWRNNAPDNVCFCPSSVKAFNRFLTVKYGSLDALGRAWGRRYSDWADVRVGPMAAQCHVEMHDWMEWIAARGVEMMDWRTRAVRAGDADHPIGSHTGSPSIFGGTMLDEHVFSRGIDADLATGDFYGLSLFPHMRANAPMSATEIGARLGALAGLRGETPMLLSELQGGPSAIAGVMSRSLSGREQQSWVWSAVAHGLRGVILWAWRNEIFGTESSGFGFTSDDGLADDRRAAMLATARLLNDPGLPLADFCPDTPDVAVLFQRDGYFVNWMDSKGVGAREYRSAANLLAYCHAMERASIRFRVIDDCHLPAAAPQRLIIVPDAIVLGDATVDWLLGAAHRGATVFVEGLAGSFGPDLFFRNVQERTLFNRLDIQVTMHRAAPVRRRVIPSGAIGNTDPLDLVMDATECVFDADAAGAIALLPDHAPIALRRRHGAGQFVFVGTRIGAAAISSGSDHPHTQRIDKVVDALLACAAVTPAVKAVGGADGFCTATLGRVGGQRVLIVINADVAQQACVTIAGEAVPLDLRRGASGHTVFVEPDGTRTQLWLSMEPFDVAIFAWPESTSVRKECTTCRD